MSIVAGEQGSEFRAITDEEIAHYQENGWVKLEKFVPLKRTDDLLALAKSKMGEQGDRNAPPAEFRYFNPLTMHGLGHPIFDPVIRHCGKAARGLMARKAPVGVRYFTDYYAVKLPARENVTHGGAADSDWHQDYAASASDRSGGMVFWVALTDLEPQKGTMAFMNGSQRFGTMGHYTTYGEGNLLDSYPELFDRCTVSDSQIYAAGDVTVHSNLTVHSAGPNTTSDPRWTYIVIVNPADACWTGGAADAFDTSHGFRLHREFDDQRFPIIG